MIAQSVAEILNLHVKLAVEGIDRMYLNVYVPDLQYELGIVGFFREHRGQPLPSAALMSPMTRRFVAALEGFVAEQRIPLVQFFRTHRGQPLPSAALMSPMTRSFVAKLEDFVAGHDIPLVQFEKGQRKDAVMAEHLRRFAHEEGVVFVGKAQENTPVFRTERRRSPTTGRPYPWIVRRSAMVNNYYIYAVDRDFGPFFLKFCSYFPFNAKLCLNGHEYAKRQLAQQGIAFEALDNGILNCADPRRLQKICEGLSAAKIDALLRKWLRLLPHPFTGADRKAGYCYDISILQAGVLDHPGARPPSARPLVLRAGDPREPRSGSPPGGAADLQSHHHPQDTGTVPHPHRHPGRHSVLERLLQEHADQAVPQGRSGPADRNDHQKQLRLRHRQAPAQLAEAARDRLCGQSPAARSRTFEP